MLEWLKRHAWKACIRQNRISGSNPDLSARKSRTPRPGIFFRQNSSSLYASYASSGRVWSTESFRSAAVGRYFWCPPAAPPDINMDFPLMPKMSTLPYLTHYTLYPKTQKKEKQPPENQMIAFLLCRGTVTRTQDPLVPNQMR